MGLLIDGRWHDAWYDTDAHEGRFRREDSHFRDWITPAGNPASNGETRFPARAGRYHLYLSYACPWSHRALIYHRLKQLDRIVSLSVTHWLMGDNGWTFAEGEGLYADPHCDADYLYQVYQAADPHFTGRATVPVLWDTRTETIVSNESADIIRMFDSAFDGEGAAPGTFYPEHLREDIDALNRRIYTDVNNGVYRAGFATTQQAYEDAINPLFDTLEWLDDRLTERRFLLGDKPSEADWRLFPTLVRFDSVYHGHFKCNLHRLTDYPNLWAYTRDLYQHDGIASTVRLDHIKPHYYLSHDRINPNGIVPAGPVIDFETDHGRARLAA